MGISQLLTDSISKLTAKFQCKNCLYPSGSVEHSTQWLLCLLPCQGTVPNLTPSAVILSLEKPKRALPSVLSPLLQVTSSQAVRGAAAHVPESQCYSQILSASLHSNSSSQNPCQSPEQPAPHRQTPHPSLPLLAKHIYLPGQEEEGMKLLPCCSRGTCGILQFSAAPALPSSCSVPLHSLGGWIIPTGSGEIPHGRFIYFIPEVPTSSASPHSTVSEVLVCFTHQDTLFHSRNTWVGLVSSSSLHIVFLIPVWPGKLI